MNNSRIRNGQFLAVANFAVVLYFSIFYFINKYKIQQMLLGVINEMLTLPMLFLQLVLLALGIIQVLTRPVNYLLFCSLILLAVCACLTLGSFFSE
jgi:hypothetical protein